MTSFYYKLKPAFIVKLVLAVLFLSAAVWAVLYDSHAENVEVTDEKLQESFNAAGKQPVEEGLPKEERFKLIADNEHYELYVDDSTAHFQVKHKEAGTVWRSYPDPAYWEQETATSTWKSKLTSPIVIESILAENFKSTSSSTSLLEDGGYLEQFQTTDNGFQVTFVFPKSQFKIPVEVSLADDYVEVKLIEEGFIEGKLSLLNAKLYPLFGAEPTTDEEGYLFIPDGSGALITFEKQRIMPNLTYNESIYGADLSYYNEATDRERIIMPVYGLKSGEQGFLAIVTEGEAFAHVHASPAGAMGISNWITTEWQFRKKFFQTVSKNDGQGFYTYNGDRLSTATRATRYYPLLGEDSDYVAMANVYRNYLIEEKYIEPIAEQTEDIPLFVDLIGGDIKRGLITDEYLKVTDTEDAKEIVDYLYYQLGIHQLKVNYIGWQQDGYSTNGGYFPVEKRLGGNKGMKSFIDYAHSLQIPVLLAANYTLNSNGDDGFWWRRDGLINLAGTVIEQDEHSDDNDNRYVSPLFYEKVINKDLSEYKSLNADGIYFIDGVGSVLATDFNPRYRASRVTISELQAGLFDLVSEQLGTVIGNNPNFYTLKGSKHVHRLTSDYSYDVFVTKAVPFAQIVLHGLRTYTLELANLRDEWESGLLKSIEYGAYPAYALGSNDADNWKQAYSISHYSLKLNEWSDAISEEYRVLNEVLKPVQHAQIIGHRALAEGVMETVYSNHYRTIVNYNEVEYIDDDIVVAPRHYLIINEEEPR